MDLQWISDIWQNSLTLENSLTLVNTWTWCLLCIVDLGAVFVVVFVVVVAVVVVVPVECAVIKTQTF